MRILIYTYGTRGDVQPYVALGVRLQSRGHEVTLATSDRFRDFVEQHGLGYGYLSDDVLSIIDTDQGRELLENSNNLYRMVQQGLKVSRQIKPAQRKLLHECWEVALQHPPDFILYHPKAAAGPHIAEKLRLPCALASPLPMYVPTGERPFVVFPELPFGRWYNRLSYRLIRLATASVLGGYIQEFRESIGLPPLRRFDFLTTGDGRPIPVLHAFSEAVFPRPADWPETAVITGYWFLDEDPSWQPSAELEAFLAAGPPPVYIGFGSMSGRNPARRASMVIDALQQAGARGILATGWGGLQADELPETIFKIDQAPHHQIFPRVSAVVHHGGAGTTAAGLRAGKPSILLPFFADQPFWGRQVHALGAGPKPIPQKKCTAGLLAAAIRQATTDQEMITTAEAIGETIRSEDGIGAAMDWIERWMESGV